MQQAWQRTSPLSAVFFIGRIVQTVAKNAVQAFAPIAAYSVASEGPVLGNAIVGVAIFSVGVVVVGILRYVFFRFRIDDGSILIRDGIFKKTQLDIDFGRIQAVNTRQNVFYRPFALVDVLLDTAGSSDQEGYLPAVPSDLASDLEARLRDARVTDGDDEDVVEEESPDAPLLTYGNGDLVVIGLTSNRALVFLAVLAPFVEALFEQLGRRLATGGIETPERLANTGLLSLAAAILVFAALVLLVLAAASIVGAVLRYYRFELVAGERRLRATGGLLTRHEMSVRFSKLQSLYVYENPVQRIFGVMRLQARQAASGKESAKKSLMLPLIRPPELDAVTRTCLGDEFPQMDLAPRRPGYLRVHPHYVRSRVVVVGVVPALFATLIMFPMLRELALLFLLWAPLSWPYFLRRYRLLGVRSAEDGLTLRSGFLGYRVVGFLYRKVQRVTLSQSWFQKRRSLATVRLYLASGSLRIPYVPLADAERLRDYVLFCVESDLRSWA